MTASAFGVERGVVEKGAEKVVGTRGDKRNTKYTAAVLAGTNTTGLLGMHHPAALAAGGAIGASMYHAHRHSPQGAAGIRRSRAAAKKRRATAKEVGPTLRGPVDKSAFGVEKAMPERAKNSARGAAGGAAGAGIAGLGTAAVDAHRAARSAPVPRHGGAAHASAARRVAGLKDFGRTAKSGKVGLVVAAGGVGGALGGLAAKKKVSKSAFGVEL